MTSIEGGVLPRERKGGLRARAVVERRLRPRLRIAAWLVLAFALASELSLLASGGSPATSSNLVLASIACVILAAAELRAFRHASIAIAFLGGSAFATALVLRMGAPEESIVVSVEAAAFLVGFAALLPIGWTRQLALGTVTAIATAIGLVYVGATLADGVRAVCALGAAAAGAAAITWIGDLRESRLLGRLERLRRDSRERLAQPAPAASAEHRIADLSHDLRNPLAVALGYSEMAADADLPDEERARALARVKRSLWELTQMVENVLESSADDAGALVLASDPVEVVPLCEELGAAARILARGRPLRILVAAEPELFVRADRPRLVRVLSNLIGNAIKYTDRGEVALRATRAGDRILLEVSDTGPGIAADEIPRIFDRYAQLASGQARGGVGLGLSISHLLTERMGGSLTVESTPGAGSRFRVALPIAHVARRARLEPRAA